MVQALWAYRRLLISSNSGYMILDLHIIKNMQHSWDVYWIFHCENESTMRQSDTWILPVDNTGHKWRGSHDVADQIPVQWS